MQDLTVIARACNRAMKHPPAETWYSYQDAPLS